MGAVVAMNPAANGVLPRGDRMGHAILAGLLVAMFAASLLGVDRWRVPGLPSVGGEGATICTLRRLTGLPCATCGLTRSFCSLGRGEFAAAFRYHPLGPAACLALAVVMVRSAAIAMTGRRVMPRTARALVGSVPVLAVAAGALWVVRLVALFASGEAADLWRASVLGRLIEMLR
jgi:hypothetical protein